MTTPTPEQLQEFKDFYVELYTKKDGAEKAKQLLRYADEWWIMAYNNNAAYAHHKLMKQETYLIEKLEEAMASYDFPKREKDLLYFATQGLRKVAALQELVESSMKEVHKHTRLTLEFKDKVVELQQQLTEANAEIERLKGMIGVKHIPPITGSGVKYENGQSEIVSTLCNKCQKPYCICKR